MDLKSCRLVLLATSAIADFTLCLSTKETHVKGVQV